MPESRRCRGDVEGVEWGAQNMEDGNVGVRTWLQLMCCALAEEQGCP